jgi:2-oxo-4-hydroxy-4-carboxy--5-ureidoimidazoline (OHCU) decarboxylase
MVDFNRTPTPKSEAEQEFDKLNAEYTEKFGQPYFFDFAADSMTQEETLADIRRRIANNDPQKEPEYKPGVDY